MNKQNKFWNINSKYGINDSHNIEWNDGLKSTAYNQVYGSINGSWMDDLGGNNQHEKPTKTVCIFAPVQRIILSSLDQAHALFKTRNETKTNHHRDPKLIPI